MIRQAELDDLRDRIARLVEASAIGERLHGVVVETTDEEEDGGFLRVVISVRDLAEVEAQDAAPLIKSIEETVAEVDERFPSVRFNEAA